MADRKTHSKKAIVFVAAICVDDIDEGSVRSVEADCFGGFLECWTSWIHSRDATECLGELGLEVLASVGAHVRAQRMADAVKRGGRNWELGKHLKIEVKKIKSGKNNLSSSWLRNDDQFVEELYLLKNG